MLREPLEKIGLGSCVNGEINETGLLSVIYSLESIKDDDDEETTSSTTTTTTRVKAKQTGRNNKTNVNEIDS